MIRCWMVNVGSIYDAIVANEGEANRIPLRQKMFHVILVLTSQHPGWVDPSDKDTR